MGDDDLGVVKVGSKDMADYVEPVKIQLDKEEVSSVTLSARGSNLRKVVQLAEYLKKQEGLIIWEIVSETQTYEFENDEGETVERSVVALHIDIREQIK